MPIDEFQLLVLSTIAKNRNPNSYVAGGAAINAASNTPRFSSDLDLFHASSEAVQLSFATDRESLERAGFAITVHVNQPGFVSAVVTRGRNDSRVDSLKLEWANDSAFRFFPVESDPVMGYRLHVVDLATNKCLALAGRSRDIIDALYLDEQVISLASTIWAACGKDPGLTPDLVLSQLRRNSKISPDSLALERTVRPVDPIGLKRQWLECLDTAEDALEKFPSEYVGCLFVDQGSQVPRVPILFSELTPHFGSVGGAWPAVRTSI